MITPTALHARSTRLRHRDRGGPARLRRHAPGPIAASAHSELVSTDPEADRATLTEAPTRWR